MSSKWKVLLGVGLIAAAATIALGVYAAGKAAKAKEPSKPMPIERCAIAMRDLWSAIADLHTYYWIGVAVLMLNLVPDAAVLMSGSTELWRVWRDLHDQGGELTTLVGWSGFTFGVIAIGMLVHGRKVVETVSQIANRLAAQPLLLVNLFAMARMILPP